MSVKMELLANSQNPDVSPGSSQAANIWLFSDMIGRQIIRFAGLGFGSACSIKSSSDRNRLSQSSSISPSILRSLIEIKLTLFRQRRLWAKTSSGVIVSVPKFLVIG